MTDEFEKALRDLPKRLKVMYTLRRILKLSYREIATLLNVKVGTVSSAIAEARDRLVSQGFSDSEVLD